LQVKIDKSQLGKKLGMKEKEYKKRKKNKKVKGSKLKKEEKER